MGKKIKFKLDGREVEAEEGITVLQAALAHKADIPYFCYHPKLSIAGNCRMCLVQIKGQNKPVISCRERVREGLEVDTKSPEVKKMQQGVLEFILVNHPLDCPICDQSGECDLQDHYFKYSQFPSRLEDQKVHKPKAKPLGPLVTLDDERCIVCTRCVRFCDEVAKTHELCVINRGGHSELTTYPGRELKNPYSLCTVDVCPVGALTSTDFRFRKRVWFLKTAKSLCTGCATGCNAKMDWDDGIVYRYRPRENEAVNQCWLCDAGRLSYKFINEDRLADPWLKKNGTLVKADWAEAMDACVSALAENAEGPVTGILSAQASCEENYVLYRFLKEAFPGSRFLASKKEVAEPFHDDFLIDADKNPNSAFLGWVINSPQPPSYPKRGESETSLSPKGRESETSSSPKRGEGVFFVLDTPSDKLREAIVEARPRFTVWITANAAQPQKENWADLILPKPVFAEQDGTFVNRQNRVQRFWKAFEPKGHARELWRIFGDIADRLGRGERWSAPEAVFISLANEIAAFKGLTYREIGEKGVALKC